MPEYYSRFCSHQQSKNMPSRNKSELQMVLNDLIRDYLISFWPYGLTRQPTHFPQKPSCKEPRPVSPPRPATCWPCHLGQVFLLCKRKTKLTLTAPLGPPPGSMWQCHWETFVMWAHPGRNGSCPRESPFEKHGLTGLC